MDIKVTKRTFADINDFPETVYKYRSWTDPYHKTIISDQIVFMARPTSFEDKLDCKLMKRYDLMTDDDIYNKYYGYSKMDNPERTEDQHKQFAKEWFDKSPMRDKDYLKQMEIDHFKKFDERFGVLSLTENPKNNKMWTKYSDEHKGFCVGFHAKAMFEFLGGGGIVTYHDELPIIKHDDSREVEHFKQVFAKERKWDFEEEYRTFTFNYEPLTNDNRKVKLPKNCYSKIIFGANMPADHRQQIIDTCKSQSLTVTYSEDVIKDNGEIEIRDIK